MTFLQSLLDATFLSLLQYPPSHPLLARISEHLAVHLNTVDAYTQLSGPLEPFAKAHRRVLEGHASKDKEKGDLKKRKKATLEQAGAAIGMYRLEELTI